MIIKTSGNILEVTKKLSENLREIFIAALDDAMQVVGNNLSVQIREGKMSGNPIRRRTGNLQNSISYNYNKANKSVEVGSFGVEYARYLEYAERFTKYRWLRSSWEENKKDLKKDFDEMLIDSFEARLRRI